MRVVGITSPKGGVGKSALTCQLACHLSRSLRTVVVDSDINRSAIAFRQRGGDALSWHAIPPAAAATGTRDAELVLLDTAGGDRTAMAEVAQGCDFVLVPVTPTPSAVQVTLQAASVFQAGGVPWGIALTMVDSRRSGDADQAGELLRAAGLPVLDVRTTRLSCWEKAEALGIALADVPSDSNRATAAEQVRKLSQLIF